MARQARRAGDEGHAAHSPQSAAWTAGSASRTTAAEIREEYMTPIGRIRTRRGPRSKQEAECREKNDVPEAVDDPRGGVCYGGNL